MIYKKMRCLCLNEFPLRDRIRIKSQVWKYLLGYCEYSECYHSMTISVKGKKRPISRKRQFTSFITSLSQREIEYILLGCRQYAYNRKRAFPIRRKISFKDSKKIRKTKTSKLVSYPTIEEVLINLKPMINSKAYKTLSWFPSDVEITDLQSEISAIVILTYRKYIFSYNLRNWNEKVLYSCLIKAIHTRTQDLIRKLNSEERKVHIRCNRMDDYYQNNLV
jgi:hypothetical protein